MNTPLYKPEADAQDLFAEEDLLSFQEASTGQRFLNFLIDGLLSQFSLSLLLAKIFVMIVVATNPDLAYELFSDQQSFRFLLMSYALSSVSYVLYYTLCETFFKGHTLGKLITGTRAIRLDGRDLKFTDALLRSLSRLVPFEPFTAFNELWHDTWTRTAVVKTR